MLTFPRILCRALLIVGFAVLGDGVVSFGSTRFGFSFIEVIGDVMLVEVAILFIVAALIEFSSSVGGAQLRRLVLGSRQEYSSSAHNEAGRKALVLVLAGMFMFAILIAIALISVS
jgi:hypothetical protein